ncbi:MAG: undecaprenyl-diphosphatase UppP [Candidatus Delongbacteria bacterium]|nr:undecaprenyl-diphosphatase UppP [Candidatus Delongbacteria bacterium]MBN2836286.1 undecaprenyl-diphosphatase UppP [Candidatus Delongbacteria bacterium]
MSEFFKSIVMGIIQGATEFLPISSSGHLAILHKFLGLNTESNLFFDVVLHLGTLLAVLIFYRNDIRDIISGFFYGMTSLVKKNSFKDSYLTSKYPRLSLLIIVGSIPTAIIGLLFKDRFEELAGNLLAVGIALTITGLLLTIYEMWRKGYKNEIGIGFLDALIIGIVQGIAIIPGISRSGSTISAGKFLGLKKETAANFSFLLSIPAVGGAFLLQLKDVLEMQMTFNVTLLVTGFISSFISGYLCLKLLIWLIKKANLKFFALYCFLIGIFTISYSLI